MSTIGSNVILKNLRSAMKSSNYVSKVLHAYVIPSADAHQSEYLAAQDQRREYVSSFTGSCGTAVVTEKYAALWVDGRYYNQAEKQLDSNWTLMKDGLPDTPSKEKWLNDVLQSDSIVGVDPFLLDYNSWSTLSTALNTNGHTLVPVTPNLVDVVWEKKPERQLNNVDVLPLKYTGKSWQEKVTSVRNEMEKEKASVLVVSALDEVAWLFNLRGSDITYNPVFFSYAILTQKSIHLFVDSSRLTHSAVESLEGDVTMKVTIHPYGDIVAVLENVVEEEKEGKFWISPLCSYALVSLLPEKKRLLKYSPVAIKKSLKNEAEISGAKNAHIKDAVAVCEFFAWLTKEISQGKNVTEISAAEKIEYFRSLQEDYVSLSFATISAVGSNCACVHYNPKKETNKTITSDEMYLCDSGGQYRDGTTDTTRTVHLGNPSSYEKECYTRVLKGQIAVSTLKFPKLVKGMLIDSFARKYLWDSGLDYKHGTGHGVGAFLNVHEGPFLITGRNVVTDPGLQPGMISSIEPGYYEDGKFGIRLENLAVIKEAETAYGQGKSFLTFETITFVPYQAKLIETSLLTAQEIQWVNDYHATCRGVVGDALKAQKKTEALEWLLKETEPLKI